MAIRICPHEYEEELGAQLYIRSHTRHTVPDKTVQVFSLAVVRRAGSTPISALTY